MQGLMTPMAAARWPAAPQARVLPITPRADARKSVTLEEIATWAIRDQCADHDDVALFDVEAAAHRGDHERDSQRPSADGCAAIARKAAIGCDVDGRGYVRGVQPNFHPDAEAVVDAIRRIPGWRERGLVLQYSGLGDRPDWSNGAQVLVRVDVADDKRGYLRHKIAGDWERVPTVGEYARWRQRRGLRIVDPTGRSLVRGSEPGQRFRNTDDGGRECYVRHCPVEPWPSDACIANTNAIYSVWHAGMMALLGGLIGMRLKDHRVTGFDAPARPWR